MSTAMPRIRILTTALIVPVALPLVANAQTACGDWETVARVAGDRFSDLVAFDDGTGVRLYAAGLFDAVFDPVHGAVPGPHLVRWDGAAWSQVPGLDGWGEHLDARAIDMKVFDDGTGPALSVAGDFEDGAGLVANGLARWDGATWSTLGDPATAGLYGRVHAIETHDAGDGEKLYIAGMFLYSDFSSAPDVFVWDGQTWAPAGDNAPEGDVVYDLKSFGGDLYAAGPFRFEQGDIRSGIVRFDGSTWSVPLGDDQRVSSTEFWRLQPWTIDGRDVLVAGGQFAIIEGGEVLALNIATWDGTRWDALPGSGMGPGLRIPTSLSVFDDGTGEALFIGGVSSTSRGETVYRWKDGRFEPVVGLTNTTPYDLAVFDDGDGPALYAGGGNQPGLYRWRPATPCAIDLTADCTVDLFDFLEFQNLFDAGDLAADFDGDGALTIFDFLAFQNAFDLGCP